MGKIFVNYRRDDVRGDARGIYQALLAKYGADGAFLDVSGTSGGQNFEKVIAEELAKSDVLLAVVGPSWMRLLGERTSSEARDFLREEIATALERDLIVIPVLIDRTPPPRAGDLPTDIAGLAVRETEDIRFKYFDDDMKRLIKAIDARRKEAALGQMRTGAAAASTGRRWPATGRSGLSRYALPAGATVVALSAGLMGARVAGVPVPWFMKAGVVGNQVADADRKRLAEEKTRKDAEVARINSAMGAPSQIDDAKRKLAAIQQDVERNTAAASALIGESGARQTIDKVTVVIPNGLETRAFASLAARPSEWLKCIDYQLVKGGLIVRAERANNVANPSTDIGLDLTFVPRANPKGASFFGVPIPCMNDRSCTATTEPVKVAMFAIKISHAAEIEQRVRKAALFMPSRTPFAQCSVGNTETYYLYTEPIDPWPMPDARALEAAGLILKGDAGDDVPMTTVAINPKKPGVSMTAVARK